MLQEVLVSPTAKLDISKLLKSSPSPSPPPRSISSRPSLSRSFSLSVTESNPRFGASPTTSTAPPLPASTFLPQPFNVPRQPSIGSQASLLIPATSSKRTASTSPQDSRQERKKPSRQWSKADSEELLKLRTGGKKWDDIAARFSGRSNTACRLRYQNYLERRYPWTEEEKKALAQLYERYVAFLLVFYAPCSSCLPTVHDLIPGERALTCRLQRCLLLEMLVRILEGP